MPWASPHKMPHGSGSPQFPFLLHRCSLPLSDGNEQSLEHLHQILLYRELEFPLSKIKAIMASEDFDRYEVLDQQIEMLKAKKARLENLILFARGIKFSGGGKYIMSGIRAKYIPRIDLHDPVELKEAIPLRTPYVIYIDP